MDSHSSTVDPTAAAAAMAGFGIVGALVFLALFIFLIVIYWKIASKAGYNGAMSLLLLVPLVNIVVIVMFAFSEWPVLRELAMYRAGAAGAGGAYGGGGFAGGSTTPTWTPPTPPSAGPYLPPGA